MYSTGENAYKVGLVMRTFTRDPTDLDKQVKKVVNATKKALQIDQLSWGSLFDRIDIVIPTDKRYKMSDFGGMAAALDGALNQEFSQHGDRSRVFVNEVVGGDNNVGVLNSALKLQLDADIDFMIVNSPSAAGYLTAETVIAMCEAHHKGGVVVGVVLPESPHPTLASMGLVQNTLAGYNVEMLSEVGGFDMMAALAPEGQTNPNAGVEEIPVLLELTKYLENPFIAMVEPVGSFVRWQLPAEGTEDRAHHVKNHATKLERMHAHARTKGMDLSVLESYVMPEYRFQA